LKKQWGRGKGNVRPTGNLLGKGPIESGMILDGSETIPGHVRYQCKGHSQEARGERASEDEHLPQTAWTPAPPAPKGEGMEPSVHMTTSYVGRLRRKSATALDRPGLKREQPLIKVVTMKFEGGPRGNR